MIRIGLALALASGLFGLAPMPSTAQAVQVDGAALPVLFDAREALAPPGRVGNDVLTPTVAIEMAVQTTPAHQDAETVSSDIAAADVVSGSAIAELYVPRSDKRGGRQQLDLRVVSERQRVQAGETVALAVIVKGTQYAQDPFTITVALPKGADLAAGSSTGFVNDSGHLVFANITPPKIHAGTPVNEADDEMALPFALVLGADMRNNLRLRAHGETHPSYRFTSAASSVEIGRVGPGVRVGEQGGEAKVDDRISLQFASGALTKSADIVSVAYETPLLKRLTGKTSKPAKARAEGDGTEELDDDGEDEADTEIEGFASLVRFDAGPSMVFGGAVTATIRLGDVFTQGVPSDLTFFHVVDTAVKKRVGAADTGKEVGVSKRTFTRLEGKYDAVQGAFVVQLPHFSSFALAIPNSSGSWTPSWTEAGFDAFSGGMSWSHPFPMPAGAGGATPPGMALSYSSRSVDGLAGYGQTDGAGLGWNLDSAEIAFAGIRMQPHPTLGHERPYWSPTIQLVLNGKSTRLVPTGVAATGPAWPGFEDPSIFPVWQYQRNEGTYVTEDNQFWKINWHASAPDGGVDGWWEVITGDGTRWQFGSDDASRVVIRSQTLLQFVDAGRTKPAISTVRWRLRKVIFTNGQEANYYYFKERFRNGVVAGTPTQENQCAVWVNSAVNTAIVSNMSHCGDGNWRLHDTSDRASYLDRIEWGDNKFQIVYTRRWETAGMTTDGLTENARHEGVLFWQTRTISEVQIIQRANSSGGWVAVSRWDFKYGTATMSWTDFNTPKTTNLRVLNSIQQVNPAAPAQVLPPKNFVYANYDNKGTEWSVCSQEPMASQSGPKTWCRNTYPYPRLSQWTNGYGGQQTFAYEAPDGVGNGGWGILKNYRLAWRQASGTIGRTLREEYVYPGPGNSSTEKDRCYVAPNNWQRCYWPWEFNNAGTSAGGGFVGYRWVQTIAKDAGTSEILARSRQFFAVSDYPGGDGTNGWADWKTKGRPVASEKLSADGNTVLASSENGYEVRTYNGSPYQFSVLNKWSTNTMDGITTRTETDYDPLGFPSQVRNQGNTGLSGDEVYQNTTYAHNVAAMILGKPASHTVYSPLNAVFAAVTEFQYDAQAGYAGAAACTLAGVATCTAGANAPTKGLLAKVRNLNPGGSPADVVQSATYDALSNLISITDGRGYLSSVVYDPSNRYVVSSKNALNHETKYFYHGVNEAVPTAGQLFGTLKAVRDPNSDANGSVQTLYTYDAFGRLKQVIKPGDSTTHPTELYFYHDTGDSGAMAANASGQNPFYVDKLVRRTTGAGVYYGFFDANWKLDPTAMATFSRTYYDGLGRVIQTQTPSGDYNNQTGAGSEIVQDIYYDALGRARRSSVPYAATPYVPGTSGGLPVNPFKNPVTTQPASVASFDILGRQIGAVGPDGATTTTGYFQNYSYTFDPKGHSKVSQSDGLGRVLRMSERTNEPTVWESESHGYHQAGVSCSATLYYCESPAAGNTARYLSYGPYLAPPVFSTAQMAMFRLAIDNAVADNNVVARIEVYNASTGIVLATRDLRRGEFGGNWGMSDFGLPFDTTSVGSNLLEYRVYWLGNAAMRHDRTAVTWGGTAQHTYYEYNGLGGLSKVTDPASNITTITYDRLGRKTNMTDPDMGFWQYGYDANGNLISQTDAKNQTLTFGYDELNRNVWKYLGSQLLTRPFYDRDEWGNLRGASIGRRVEAWSMDGTGLINNRLWSYDNRGRVTNEQSYLPETGYLPTTYAYDAADRVTSMTYPDGEVVNTTYDNAGRPRTLGGNWGNYVAEATYTTLGQPREVRLANGLSQRRFYHGLDAGQWWAGSPQPYGPLYQSCITATSNGDCWTGAPLMHIRYWYDPAGNQLSNVDHVLGATQNNNYSYDALDRLTGWSLGGVATESYQYSPIGNITYKTNIGTYDYAGAKPHAVKTTSTGGAYAYDPNGNMTSRRDSTSAPTYSIGWNTDNKVASMAGNGISTQYFYDADGNRVKKIENGTTTIYVGKHHEMSLSPNFEKPVTLVNANRVSVSGNNIQRNDGLNAWDSGASSTAYCTIGFCSAYTTVDSTSGYRMYGLSNADTDSSFASIRYALYLVDGGSVQIYESGAFKGSFGVYGIGDTFAVQVDGDNRVRYYRLPAGGSWTNLYTSLDIPTYPLRLDTSVYSNGGKLSHLRMYGTLKTSTNHHFFNGSRIAMRTGGSTGSVTYLHGDHLGSTSLATNAAGAKASELRYTPFGSERYSWNTAPTEFKFHGNEHRSESSGLIDMAARQYDPKIGRFISADVIVPDTSSSQSFNRYSYVRNNPINRGDPTGHLDANCEGMCGAARWGGSSGGGPRGGGGPSRVLQVTAETIVFGCLAVCPNPFNQGVETIPTDVGNSAGAGPSESVALGGQGTSQVGPTESIDLGGNGTGAWIETVSTDKPLGISTLPKSDMAKDRVQKPGLTSNREKQQDQFNGAWKRAAKEIKDQTGRVLTPKDRRYFHEEIIPSMEDHGFDNLFEEILKEFGGEQDK